MRMNKIANYIIIILLILTITTLAVSFMYQQSTRRLAEKTIQNTNVKSITALSEKVLGEQTQTSNARTDILQNYQIPILMYHYVREFNDPKDKIGTNLSVSPTNFDKQMNWLKTNNYRTVNSNYLLNPVKLDFKPIILTFDDGYRDMYTDAFPILIKYRFTGTFYIVSDYVNENNERYLNWDMVKEMSDAGMTIGSHTLTHIDLTKNSDVKINTEIAESKKIIGEKIGKDIEDFCYPSGKFNNSIANIVKNAGYQTATTVKTGAVTQKSDLFQLPRYRIENTTNLEKILK